MKRRMLFTLMFLIFVAIFFFYGQFLKIKPSAFTSSQSTVVKGVYVHNKIYADFADGYWHFYYCATNKPVPATAVSINIYSPDVSCSTDLVEFGFSWKHGESLKNSKNEPCVLKPGASYSMSFSLPAGSGSHRFTVNEDGSFTVWGEKCQSL